ncbi:MAG: hypothetical protein WAN36_09440, partial [Calditrichia bacterium]
VVAVGIGIPGGQTFNTKDSFYKRILQVLAGNGKRVVYFYTLARPPQQTAEGIPLMLDLMRRTRLQENLDLLAEPGGMYQPLYLSALTKALSYRVDSSALSIDLQQISELSVEASSRPWTERLSGSFIPTYSDYYLQTPSLQAGPKNKFRLNNLGLLTLDRVLKKGAGVALQPQRGRRAVSRQYVSEKQQTGTFIFIIFGLSNFLLFLLIYRLLIDFRKDVHRAVSRSHGFFTDLQERRQIGVAESLFLLLVLAVNGGVMIGSLLYFFRNHLLLDYLISLFAPNPGFKLFLAKLLWNPLTLIPVLALLMIFSVLLLSLFIRLRSVFKEPRVRFRQAMAVSIWAGSHFLFLLPFGMFFYNLLLALNSNWILLAILLYFHVWYILRWMNGARVLLEVSYSRILSYTAGFSLIFAAAVLFFLHWQIDLSAHISFIIHLIQALNW